MPRPPAAAYELTEAEKRDLIKRINEGRTLPEHFRFLLFDDKREVELVWNGKTRDVCTAILPFQTLEHIDEPRKETAAADELGLDIGGRQTKGWTNKLIWGDNKLILSSLKNGPLREEIEAQGGIKLIEQGKPLPEKYRFLLFADKREVELVWNGKSREVCNVILPFQTLEHIADEDTGECGAGLFCV